MNAEASTLKVSNLGCDGKFDSVHITLKKLSMTNLYKFIFSFVSLETLHLHSQSLVMS